MGFSFKLSVDSDLRAARLRLDDHVQQEHTGQPGAEVREADPSAWIREHDLTGGLRMLRMGVETHIITSVLALPLMLRTGPGLLVEMTDGTAEYNATNYRVSAFYDLAKASVIRLARAQAADLAPHGATAVGGAAPPDGTGGTGAYVPPDGAPPSDGTAVVPRPGSSSSSTAPAKAGAARAFP